MRARTKEGRRQRSKRLGVTGPFGSQPLTTSAADWPSGSVREKFPSAPIDIGFDVSMTSLPGNRSATSSTTAFIGPSHRASTIVSARWTASRLLDAAVARLPISATSFARSSGFTTERTTGSPPAATSLATVPPMFPIPITAVVMSLLLVQPFGKYDLDDLLLRLPAGPRA